ncbi:MAG: NUDIX hydrolase [Anaerolineales bacterium]
MNVKIVNSEIIYQGKVFIIRQDHVEFTPGKIMKVDIVQHRGAVVILPLDKQNNIWFVRQYRHPIGQELLELPAGTLNKGEDPLECAKREIREETGMSAESMIPIGEFYEAPGYSTENLFVFLASGLNHAPLPPDEDEMIEIVKIPLEQAYQFAKKGQIQDAKTLAALFLAESRLFSNQD